MKVDLKELEKRSEYINCQKHDTLDLLIWNYNHKCQYSKAWDEYTMMCRGLITNSDGMIIARPFKKFFNLNEKEETKIENLPSEVPLILEKLDGSLGIQYPAKNGCGIATRGSFNSDQAQWATEWFNHNVAFEYSDPRYTYLYEILYPENRIVVDYGGKEGMVLLAVVDSITGDMLNHMETMRFANAMRVETPKVINSDIQKLVGSLSNLSGNEEGFVVRYSN